MYNLWGQINTPDSDETRYKIRHIELQSFKMRYYMPYGQAHTVHERGENTLTLNSIGDLDL